MIRVGIVGLGKMGLSHYSLANAHPNAQVTAVCDTSAYLLSMIRRFSDVSTFTSLHQMLEADVCDAVIISTPSHLHEAMVESSLDAKVDVFCEKPFTLSRTASERLAEKADRYGLVTQVGYHYRFVAAFEELKRVVDSGILGEVKHVRAEATGPVVVRRSGGTWRSDKRAGGGALYDYGAHPLNLLEWTLGPVETVEGVTMPRYFSGETEDAVYANMRWADGVSGHLSVNWSDPSERKMSTRLSVWGTGGKVFADRQECRTFLFGSENSSITDYKTGWNLRYTTDLTRPVYFYLRGEEYSSQLDAFFRRCSARQVEGLNSFAEAALTDATLEALRLAEELSSPVAVDAVASSERASKSVPRSKWRRSRRD